jgi:hypothetical protein
VSDYLSELRKGIKGVYGCDAAYLETVWVTESFRGQPAWEGYVETFSLTGHPEAKHCYAWGVRRDDGNGWEVTAVLGIAPVVSPETAVRIAIAAYANQPAGRPSRKSRERFFSSSRRDLA